jgi:DNA repair exonuclease SbcCD ATPase subunit
MLELKSISLRNFWSYGDYETTFEVDGLGPCLITGTMADESDEIVDPKKISNGAGKSALVEAILWCLFGRTMRIPNPGDKVLNWFTKKDCFVELRFKNGDILRRTRNMDGHNDLLLRQAGEDISLGTTGMEQQRLNRLLNLDWDIFCGSTFFSQFGRSWMELSDTKRKDALEREFHLDKILSYANAAKTRLNTSQQEQLKHLGKIENLESSLNTYEAQITKFTTASKEFDAQKQLRAKQAQDVLQDLTLQRDAVELHDVEALNRRWGLFKKVLEKLDGLQHTIRELSQQKRNVESDITIQNRLVRKWEGKGAVCPECEQAISKEHIASKVSTPSQELDELNKKLSQISEELDRRRTTLDKAAEAIESRRPSVTIAQAEANQRQWNRQDTHVKSQRTTINKIEVEENHYDETIADLENKTKTCKTSIEAARKIVGKIDRLILHLNYIYRAYHDRRRIKSYMLAEYIPYLNDRIAYYLNKFGFDLRIEFTNALGIRSSHWGYQSFSGGECKRFDVAMMLAMFDLHTIMYGRHCNIIVFDEVDGRLDARGAEIFAEIIRSDFAGKVDSILVITQRADMRGSMPSEIKIIREDRFSKISEVLR